MRKTTVTALVLGSSLAMGSQTAWGQAINPQSDPVPPNIFFLVDFSDSMASCWAAAQSDLDSDGKVDYSECTPARTAALSIWHLTTVKEAVEQVVTATTTARFGFAVTDPTSNSPDGIGYQKNVRDGIVSPLGADTSTFLTRWNNIKGGPTQTGTLEANTLDAAPLSEALDQVGGYFISGDYTDESGYTGISPIEFYCQESHVIIITDGVTTEDVNTPDIDKNVSTAGTFSADPDLQDNKPYTVLGAYNQYLDNIASYLANEDMSVLMDSPDAQHVVTHVIALDKGNDLFQYAADNSGGIYSIVTDPEKFEGELWTIVNSIMSGTFVQAPPTVTADGENLYLGYFKIEPERPLYYGYLASFTIDTDMNSSTFGELDLSVPQPSWEAGEILASRLVGQQDVMSQDNNGTGLRDIYTNMDDDRIPDAFDATNLNSLCPLMLDTSVDSFGVYEGVALGHDIDEDNDVDLYDCAALMDFVRGFHLSEFISTGQPRGHWKLGDIRHSQVAVADAVPRISTTNPTLKTFLDSSIPKSMSDCPYSDTAKCTLDVVFVTANDGMLHAFSRGSGDELWAYIPGNLLGERDGAGEIAEILDMMSGETIIMDATPHIKIVWIDGYAGDGQYNSGNEDGVQQLEEWLRVLVIGEGGGGRTYTALDITDPQHPFVLWEDTNDNSPTTGLGATVSTAVAGLITDQNYSPANQRWVAFYGSGQEVESGEGDKTEARLYIKALDDSTTTLPGNEAYTDRGIEANIDLDADGWHDGNGFPSNPTAVDRDSDGDIDEVFLVSSAGVMYKFVIDISDIDDTESCLFFDPQSAYLPDGSVTFAGTRTTAYWAATATYNWDGQVVIYWGTGSPYDLFTSDYGYLYAVVSNPGCVEGYLYTECAGDGYLQLARGEKLTGPPAVFAGGVYFTTFRPSDDRCEEGEGRMYGLSVTDCSSALDTNDDGAVNAKDDQSVVMGEGIPAGVVIANNHLYSATSNGLLDSDAAEQALFILAIANNHFGGVFPLQWREIF